MKDFACSRKIKILGKITYIAVRAQKILTSVNVGGKKI